tara:strand:+ start:7314 stop:7613 length:300 start_codon:yes stop_codon:yes gene_type:complete
MKTKHRWNYRELSKPTKYSESGIREAFKNNTLNYQSIVDIIKDKEVIDEFSERFKLEIFKHQEITNYQVIKILSERKNELSKNSLFLDVLNSITKKVDL